VLEFITFSPEPYRNKITDVEDKNKSQIELRQAKPKLNSDMSLIFAGSPCHIANAMLAAVFPLPTNYSFCCARWH
jgi:hypothetical protein